MARVMRRRTIFLASLGLAAAGIGIAATLPGISLAVPAMAALPLSATALPLDRDDPAATGIGALRFMGAVHLRSANPLFGGLSALRWRGDAAGGWLLSVSDTGNWVMFRPVERDGRLVGVTAGRIAPVLMADGRPAPDKETGDAEALEWPADGDDTAGIFFEQDHRLQVYPGIDPDVPASFARPPAHVYRYKGTAHWPANGGGEAFARLDGTAELVFAETATGSDGAHDVLLLSDRGNVRLGYRPPDGFSPTDAVLLDADRLLVLNRRFTATGGIGAALVLVDLAPLNAARAAGGVPSGLELRWRELAHWQPPLTLDNMEGLALRREGARVFVYIVSDDNLNPLQRTILMKFEAIVPGSAPLPGR